MERQTEGVRNSCQPTLPVPSLYHLVVQPLAPSDCFLMGLLGSLLFDSGETLLSPSVAVEPVLPSSFGLGFSPQRLAHPTLGGRPGLHFSLELDWMQEVGKPTETPQVTLSLPLVLRVWQPIPTHTCLQRMSKHL